MAPNYCGSCETLMHLLVSKKELRGVMKVFVNGCFDVCIVATLTTKKRATV